MIFDDESETDNQRADGSGNPDVEEDNVQGTSHEMVPETQPLPAAMAD